MRHVTGLAAVILLALGGCSRERMPSTLAPPAGEAVPFPRMEPTPEGLEMTFDPRVREQEALRYVFRCRAVDPADNPRLARLSCPVDLDELKIDVAEGPAGTTLMIYTGDPGISEALRRWFEEHRRN